MSDEDELKDDPDAIAIRPMHSKRTLVLATVAGAVFGLLLAITGFIFEAYRPSSRPAHPDAGPTNEPEIVFEDAGASGEPSPWLQD